MKVIADCGGTKGDWAVIAPGGEVCRLKTGGINPFQQSEADMRLVLADMAAQCAALLERANGVDVYFYGAGCSPDGAKIVQRLLQEALAAVEGPLSVTVASDLLAAAHALCGHGEGIACILGTGSNSCLYDGRQIVANTPPLGYVLGDEGSGASLGRRFLNGIFKGSLSPAIRQEFLDERQLSYPDVISAVYRQPMANRFLASVAPFLAKHAGDDEVRQLIVAEFRRFFSVNVAPYGRTDLPVGFVGGVANAFAALLAEAAALEGFTVGTVLPAPIDGLIRYHLS